MPTEVELSMHMDPAAAGAAYTSQALVQRSLDDERPIGSDRSGNGDDPQPLPAHIAAITAENHELRAEAERLRAERSRMGDILDRLMGVLGSKSADRLVHDVRNVLNERELYRALADAISE